MPRIGLQLYTVREAANSDLIGTLDAAARIGYAGVEFASVPKETAAQVALALSDLGLLAAGMVVQMDSLKDQASFSAARAYCHSIESGVILFPWLDEPYRVDAESYKRTADLLNTFGAACQSDKLRFLYHIHGYEFTRYEGMSGLEILMERCDAQLVQLELDTFWVEHAGENALGVFSTYADRCPYIHFKDMNNRQEKRDVEVGDGIVDVAGIIRAAKGHSVDWFIVEQEQFDRPPMESIAISYRNLDRLVRENTIQEKKQHRSRSLDSVVKAYESEGRILGKPRFERVVIGELENEVGPAPMNTLFNIADLNGDGLPDVFTTGRDGRMAWFENPGVPGPWTRHIVAEVERQECGGLAYDLTGNGHLDIINGGDWRSDQVSWWENPAPADGHWKRHLIAETGAGQFHDEMIGDVTGDGNLSLIFANQKAATLYRVPLPADPHVSPWPNIEVIARNLMTDDLPEEGIALADIDSDGINEIVAGTHWFKWEHGRWAQYKFANHYITTLIAVGDIDGDGQLEIVLSEGDPCIYDHPEGGKLGWFKPGSDVRKMWQEHRLADGLLDPHSLQLGDICGNGRLDILVGEISVKDKLDTNPPRLFVFENDGRGGFVQHLVDEGVGTHHARLADLQGKGKLDIVSRPLHGPDKWNIFAWYRQ